ncbi:major facilitator superfamily domain-containing protein [Zopfochytrium polystomum]|nr:major facilitator superfamily domain-containing protein [Zopfochytrium polystomum]
MTDEETIAGSNAAVPPEVITPKRETAQAVDVGVVHNTIVSGHTIVSVAFQAIATEFAAQDQVAWVATAYLLTSTAFIPSYGQLADIFGRKPTYLFAIITFEIGSALCGAANSMPFLIVARAIAGLGGGGIFSLVIIIISDLVPLRDRAKWTGVIGAGFGLAAVAGIMF